MLAFASSSNKKIRRTPWMNGRNANSISIPIRLVHIRITDRSPWLHYVHRERINFSCWQWGTCWWRSNATILGMESHTYSDSNSIAVHCQWKINESRRIKKLVFNICILLFLSGKVSASHSNGSCSCRHYTDQRTLTYCNYPFVIPAWWPTTSISMISLT